MIQLTIYRFSDVVFYECKSLIVNSGCGLYIIQHITTNISPYNYIYRGSQAIPQKFPAIHAVFRSKTVLQKTLQMALHAEMYYCQVTHKTPKLTLELNPILYELNQYSWHTY